MGHALSLPQLGSSVVVVQVLEQDAAVFAVAAATNVCVVVSAVADFVLKSVVTDALFVVGEQSAAVGGHSVETDEQSVVFDACSVGIGVHSAVAGGYFEVTDGCFAEEDVYFVVFDEDSVETG